jgi:lycopene beta-cyclase
MTYFNFLLIFVGTPTLLLGLLNLWAARTQQSLPASLTSWPARGVMLAHVLVAVIYTTPWDNYLVATRVWWYDPELVTGIVLGWVPLEEYIFFIVQTILVSFWIWFMARLLYATDTTHLPDSNFGRRLRWGSVLICGLVWLASVTILAAGWQPGTYLGLILVWALPPIMLQLGFGADILWRYGRLVALTLLPAALYLSWADTFAIGDGTWVIDPAQSTGILVGNLPIEEMIFFFATSTLIVFGTILVLARDSQVRAPRALLDTLRRWFASNADPKQGLSNA